MPPEIWLLPSFIPIHLGLFFSYFGDYTVWINLKLLYTYMSVDFVLIFPSLDANKYRKNFVLYSNGLYAHVLSVWETICWSSYTSYHAIAQRTPLTTL